MLTGFGESQYSKLMFPTSLGSHVFKSLFKTFLKAKYSSSVGSLMFLPYLFPFQLQKAWASKLLTSTGQSQGISMIWVIVLRYKFGSCS